MSNPLSDDNMSADGQDYHPVCCNRNGAIMTCTACMQQKHLRCERIAADLKPLLESRYICKACRSSNTGTVEDETEDGSSR